MPDDSNTPDPSIIVDAHQDIAWNALTYGRDFTQSVYLKRKLEQGTEIEVRNGIATSGLPEMLLGRVGIVFGTLYATPEWAKLDELESGYQTPAQAHQQGMAQLDYYHKLADGSDRIVLIQTRRDLDTVLASWAEGVEFDHHKLGIVVLMEGADPIREPKAFEEWYERGVRLCGTAWSETRYSGGTSRNGRGPGPLTAIGRELLEVMAGYNAILDLSHMSEESYLEALERYPGHIIASHSNPRYFRDTDRHLTDAMIRGLGERDGVIGIVPFNSFLRRDYMAGDAKNKTPISRVVEAIDYVCQLCGSVRHVGIGSDFDGGFGYQHIPEEMDTISDLQLIKTLLTARGYSPEDVQHIMAGNFLRVLRATLPR